jgi:hypothetical protein
MAWIEKRRRGDGVSVKMTWRLGGDASALTVLPAP